jgi:hypothetical protein
VLRLARTTVHRIRDFGPGGGGPSSQRIASVHALEEDDDAGNDDEDANQGFHVVVINLR